MHVLSKEAIMSKVNTSMRIYTVVEVARGFAAGAYSFRRLKDARMCAKRLSKEHNLQEDDVQLFEATIDAAGHEQQVLGLGR